MRYHRQSLLREIGPEGQERLARSRAAVVGCGALGCVAADWLARAGVGELKLIDRDVVDTTNLQRQTLYDEACVGVPKAHAAAERLARVNSSIHLHPCVADVNADSVDEILRPRPDIVLDGADNFETRFLINDWCVKHGVAFVYAGVIGVGGAVMSVIPGVTPCLRCVFDEPPPAGSQPTCETAGVLGPAVGIVASLQASRAIRMLVEGSAPRVLFEVEAWNGRVRELNVGERRAECPSCGRREFEFLDGDRAGLTSTLCGNGAIQVRPSGGDRSLDLGGLARRLSTVGEFHATAHLARGTIIGPSGASLEITVFGDARAIIRGVRDEADARTVYAKYVGV